MTNDDQDKKNDNVIEFPKSRMKKANRARGIYRSQIWLAASLASLLVLVTIANNQILNEKNFLFEEDMKRSLASLENQGYDIDWEHILAGRLAKSEGREIASIGKKPNPLQDLQFGVLEGKYLILLENQKVKEIEFMDNHDQKDGLTYVTNRIEFLKQHQGLFSVSFSEIEFAYNDVKKNSVTELYHFLDSDSKVIGKAQFLFDSYGRLIRMTILE